MSHVSNMNGLNHVDTTDGTNHGQSSPGGFSTDLLSCLWSRVDAACCPLSRRKGCCFDSPSKPSNSDLSRCRNCQADQWSSWKFPRMHGSVKKSWWPMDPDQPSIFPHIDMVTTRPEHTWAFCIENMTSFLHNLVASWQLPPHGMDHTLNVTVRFSHLWKGQGKRVAGWYGISDMSQRSFLFDFALLVV